MPAGYEIDVQSATIPTDILGAVNPKRRTRFEQDALMRYHPHDRVTLWLDLHLSEKRGQLVAPRPFRWSSEPV